MKRVVVAIVLLAALVIGVSSCAGSKKTCPAYSKIEKAESDLNS